MDPNGFKFSIEASDFVPSFAKPLDAEAAEFTLSVRAESFRPEEKRQKVYASELLLSLRDKFTSLPEQVEIPDPYGLHSRGRHRNASRRKNPDSGFVRQSNPLESSSILVKAENPLMAAIKADDSEEVRTLQKIRGTLNKISPENFEKLGRQLASQYHYTDTVLQKFVKMLFERATALNFPELYAKLCGFIRRAFKDTNLELAKQFRIELINMCYKCFYQEDAPVQGDDLMDQVAKQKRRLIGNIKFVGLLFKQRMLKADIMYECFEKLLAEVNDENIETYCTLFVECANLLSAMNLERLKQYYDRLQSLSTDTRVSRRIQFKCKDVLDSKDKLLVPARSVPVSPVKPTKRDVIEKFPGKITFFHEGNLEEQPSKLSDNAKAAAHGIVKGLSIGETFQEILEYSKEPLFQHTDALNEAVYEILKFALTEFLNENVFFKLAEFLEHLVKVHEILVAQHIHKGLVKIAKKMKDTYLDAPTSPKLYKLILRELIRREVINHDNKYNI